MLSSVHGADRVLAGVGRDTAHVRVERPHERAIPVLAADYCFMGEGDDDEANARCMPILVMQFDVGIWMHSHAVPNKGTSHPWVTRKLADAMVQSGFPKIISKTDNEPAVLELKRAAIRLAREEQQLRWFRRNQTNTSVRPITSLNKRCRRSSAQCER